MKHNKIQRRNPSVSLRVGAVLLAAGQGYRIGNRPKALLSLNGEPLLKHHLSALIQAQVDEIVVVTGFYHSKIESLIEPFSVKVVRNLNPSAGQTGSVRLGIEALKTHCDAVIMMLCDQPLVGLDEILSLISAFERRPHGEIVIPRVDGRRGNPVILSGNAIASILAEGPDMHCRRYMDEHPETVTYFDNQNSHFITDIDTLADLTAFREKTGRSLHLPS